MKKFLFILFVFIPVLLLVFANAVYSAPPAEPGACISFAPLPSLHLDLAVNIPDPALNAALHAKTGVPASSPIFTTDLKALTGYLDLHGLGIANAEGLQYCTNVERINLDNNHLSGCGHMPNFSGMNGLKTLSINKNDFTTVPSEIFNTPNLRYLSMRGCPITDVDLYIADLTKLRELDLSDTDLDTFPIALLSMDGLEILRLDNSPIKAIPDTIDHMTGLEELHLQNTGLKALPSPISGLTHLNVLNVSHNKLESLPGSICSLHLGELNASNNNLYDLPADIGGHVGTLLVHCNRLTAIPQSVVSSPVIDSLNIMANRLTSLPSGFAGKMFDGVNVEFNFIDVSPGSPAREALDDNESSMKHFLRQLTPVSGLTATPSPDSVTLSWSPCPDGSDGGTTWTVEGYVVYLYDGGMVKVADVDKTETSYVHTGLTPETEYSYRVGVDYRIVEPMLMIDYTNRGYTRVDATTPASGAAETIPPVSSAVVLTPALDPSSLPAAEETDIAVPGGESAFPIWAIIIAAVGALGIVGTGAAIVILKLRKPKA